MRSRLTNIIWSKQPKNWLKQPNFGCFNQQNTDQISASETTNLNWLFQPICFYSVLAGSVSPGSEYKTCTSYLKNLFNSSCNLRVILTIKHVYSAHAAYLILYTSLHFIYLYFYN